jgi:hypothetical protein
MQRGSYRRHYGRLVMRCSMFALLIGLMCWAPAARADIASVNMFRNGESVQSGDGSGSLTLAAYFLSTDLTSVNPNDYTSVTMTYGGPGSPFSLPQVSPTDFGFQTPGLPSQATMDADFPMGTYTYTTNNGDTTTLSYTADYYSNQPYFTGTTYSALQGMSTTSPFTFTFNALNPGTLPAGSTSNTFLSVFNLTTNTTDFSQLFLDPTTTSVLMPANTLTLGDSYEVQLDFDSRVFQTTPNAAFQGFIGYDLRDDIFFTTAVPEPGTIALFAPACAFLAWKTLRRRRAR